MILVTKLYIETTFVHLIKFTYWYNVSKETNRKQI